MLIKIGSLSNVQNVYVLLNCATGPSIFDCGSDTCVEVLLVVGASRISELEFRWDYVLKITWAHKGLIFNNEYYWLE